jgi:GntR family transcriptional regulator / MocR family aminotransferase
MHAAGPAARTYGPLDRHGHLTLPIQRVALNRDSEEPLYQQLFTQIRALIEGSEACLPGTRLPATRTLAAHLGVSRNTVMLAYQRLLEDGYVSGRTGAGTVVRADIRAARPAARRPARREFPATDAARPGAAFAVGVPPVDMFPIGLWTSLLSRKLRVSGDRGLLGGGGMGQWPLRRAIAAHLNLYRGISCVPEQVVVTRGLDAGLDLVIRSLLAPGDRVWCEEPGYPYVRQSLRYRGCLPMSVTVGANGLEAPEAQRAPVPSMAVVSAARQLPMAVRMSDQRRQELIGYAHRVGMWIVEHEYDGAFLDTPMLRPLFADDPEGRVIYLGTFNTALFPQLHLGFCVLPPTLAGTVGAPLAEAAAEVPTATQDALAELLEHHRFARYFGQLRFACAQRRELLRSALLALPDLVPGIEGDQSAGSFLTIRLPQQVDERRLVTLGRRRSLTLAPLSRYFDSVPTAPGLVLGCAGTSEDAIVPAVRRLGELLSCG